MIKKTAVFRFRLNLQLSYLPREKHWRMLKLPIYDLLVNWHEVQNSEKARELVNILWTHADYIQIKRYKECGTLPSVPSHQPPSSFCVMVMMSPFLNFS